MITFCADAPAERLYGFDIDGPDDIFTYGSDSGFHASLLIPNIISTFNSGRGDLASVPAPPSGCNPADLAEPFGLLDLADVTTFVAGFLASDPLADLDDSGLFDLTDVTLFVTSFLGGCP